MATAGQPFATQPVVYEVDQYGNLETGDNSTMITASLASGNGTLLGTTTATLSGGVATFVGLADNTAGTISLSFAGGGLHGRAVQQRLHQPRASRPVGDPDAPVCVR